MSKNINIAKQIHRDLSDREREILRQIVQLYILKANPIGSRFLSKYINNDLKLSPATLRNIMSDLEELEYISHPHTSAGRIPTDKGYRFYVDTISKIEKLNKKEILSVQDSLNQPEDVAIFKNASRILGMLSKYLGIVQFPNIRDLTIQKIELIELSSSKILVVVALESNIVRTVTIEADFDTDFGQLDELSRNINERVSGRKLSFIRDNFKDIVSDLSLKNAPLIRLFTGSVDKIFSRETSGDRVAITGTHHLLNYPEFEDLERVRGVIELVENEDIIIHLLEQLDDSEQVKVYIGKELNNNTLQEYSLIKSTYKVGTACGTIGLIGPKRMNYSKMISIVKYVSDYLSGNSD
ncbi:MAG: heat-inducible transcription repressor HrcA [Candidatus Kapabacteria bacterium]|nr:heat-inducible transcription repressor HrcA [Ignavibacteriota bacterium]MCW5884932.1 heat-inducible transcription repressor HrcA [Candidatus Kapabacteria bacterium]